MSIYVFPDLTSPEDDLVIEDDLESETVLGGGRAGLLDQDQEEIDMNYPQAKSKMRGMSGPISSSLDVSNPILLTTLKTKTWSKLVKWVLRMGRG